MIACPIVSRWDFHINIDGQFLSCTLRDPPKPSGICILYLHGWGGDRETLGWLLDHLCAQGHHVLNFTQRGFDGSGGRRELSRWLPDAAAIVDHIASTKLEPWVIGLSTGGSLAIALSASKPKVGGCAALAPFASFPRLFADRPDHRAKLEMTFSDLDDGMAALNAEGVVREIAPRPLLLVHGDSDDVIPKDHSMSLYDKAGEPRQLRIFGGANHVFSNIRQADLCELVSDWIFESRGRPGA